MKRWAMGISAGMVFASAAWAGNPEAEPENNYQIVTHLTQEDALKKLFPKADKTEALSFTLTPEQAARIEARVGHPLLQRRYEVFAATKAGVLLGYAMVDEEIGKYRPITSMIAIGPQGKVLGVAIMVYRESRGGEVSHARFLQQYKGKTSSDPIRVRKDIISISGATLSVRAVSTQVRKALAIVDETLL